MSQMDLLIKNLNKSAKDEVVTLGLSSYSYTRIPFTSPRLNYCTYGGLPVGKLIEFFGEEHGGKSTTALDVTANFQELEKNKALEDDSYEPRKVLYCDVENGLDVEWATKLGVDVDSMYIYQPKGQSAETLFDFVLEAISTGEIGLFILDSIAALVSSQELDKKMDEKTYAGISGPMTRFTKEVEMLAKKHNCTVIGINQQRDNLNSPYGGKTTPGGKCWKYLCSVRLEFRKGKFIDDKGNELSNSADTPAGTIILMSMVKNRTCPPNRRTGFYTLNYNYGVDYVRDLVEVAIKYGIIEKSGAWFNIYNPDTGELLDGKIQGQARLLEKLSGNEELLTTIDKLVHEKMSIK